MSGSRAGKDSKRLLGCELASLGVEGEDANEICSKVGYDEELAGRVEDGFMLVRCILSFGIRAGLGQVEEYFLLECEATGTVDV
jgi:hypothetical protein